MTTAVTLVVADDHPLFLEGVVKTLNAEPTFEVLGDASSCEGAVALVAEHMPDIALLDVSMPGDGVECARLIGSRFPVVKVVMLTVSEDEDVLNAALGSGARGFVLKGVSGPDLIEILHRVQQGEVYITPRLAHTLLRSVENPGQGPLAGLTSRERDILEEVARGASNKKVAATLGIAERTVKHHMSNILQKLQVKNRVEAALIAERATSGN